jgi:hypothetical protein
MERTLKEHPERGIEGGLSDGTLSFGLITILREARGLLTRNENDFAWSHWHNAQEAAAEIMGHLERIKRGDYSQVHALKTLFAPTGSIQDVSFSGWAQEYLRLAQRFDEEVSRLRENLVATGRLVRRHFQFKHLQVRTDEAHHLLQQLASGNCPTSVDRESIWRGGEGPMPLTIWASSEDVNAWDKFAAEHDVADYRDRFMTA